MYKFNFLNKINLEKLEEKKRNRFIKMIFLSSTSCLVLLLIILFLQSLNIGSSFNDAQDYQKRITDKSAAFRNGDFFKYKSIENAYNSALKRRSITSILNAIETSLDSTLILDNFLISEKGYELRFISRTSSSKSQLMSRVNMLKDEINGKLLRMGYINDKSEMNLLRSPDIKKNFDEFQYWVFDFGGDFKKPAPSKTQAPQPGSGSGLNLK
ncbi:TPA: hypothetical protein DCR49_02465 [Candidatus Delongbacteria bacterium]|nr:hypothetical protein [Candidatus Delongbacteria bacterium]